MKQLIRTVLRVLILLMGLLLLDRISGWRSSDWYAHWIAGKGVVKSTQEWREQYDAMELGLKGLPLSFTLPSGDEIPSVGLGTWKASNEDVVHAITVRRHHIYFNLDSNVHFHRYGANYDSHSCRLPWKQDTDISMVLGFTTTKQQ